MVDKKFNQMSRCLSRKSKKTGKEKVKCMKKVLETRMFFVLVNNLTPMEALNKLNEIKKLMGVK